MQRPRTWLVPAVAAVLVLCASGCQGRQIPGPPTHDVNTDPDADPVDVPGESLDPDVEVDPPLPDMVDPDAEDERPDAPCPPEGPVGAPCSEAGDCGESMDCLLEASHVYDGLMYVDWPSGYCIEASWTAGCDPDEPTACPEGARCVHLGASECEDRWACLDACAPADVAGVPFPFNACCRPGYRCDPGLSVCLTGCSNDRECCESWSDTDGDTERDAGEVTLDGACTRTCDTETFVCSGEGGGTYASACTIDSDCPDDASCLPEACSSIYGPSFPGGLCIRERCDLAGVDCVAGGGACVDLAVGGVFTPVCMAACATGTAPGDGAHPCRGEYACVPACDGGWVGAPPSGGEDGWCFPANASTAAADTLYAPCSADDECHSPLGLGLCLTTAGQSRCSIACNASLARDHDLCGAPTTGGGLPPGACWACKCHKACDDPASPLSSDACGASGALACYSTSALFGEIAYSAAATAPPGLCLPACADVDDCTALWGMPLVCDVVSGICS
ncbi:MAG: hypothetical protein JRG91_01760 [Deltaproteobacteria bacterium]|nr:hypothetical protein [Deltaproteobacteria bacterium]